MFNSVKRAWNKFNFVDIDSKNYLTDNDVIELAKCFDPNLNFDNDEIKNKILAFDRNITFPRSLQFYIKNNITNPNNIEGASKRTMLFWTIRGYSEDEAKEKVSEVQRKNSNRCNEYWINKGYSEDEAKEKVSEVQRNLGKRRGKPKLKNQKEFWTIRGYSKDEAKEKVSEVQRKNSNRLREKYTRDELKNFNKMCLEYWLYNGYSEQDYENYRNSLKMPISFRSNIADEFVSILKSKFSHKSNIYCMNNEFGKYIPNYRYVRYDYVDILLKVVIEFHGDYYHKNSEEHDNIKQKYMEDLGFKYIIVWESEYRKDRKNVVNKILKEINENN